MSSVDAALSTTVERVWRSLKMRMTTALKATMPKSSAVLLVLVIVNIAAGLMATT